MAQPTVVKLTAGRDGTYAERHPHAAKAARVCGHAAAECSKACARATLSVGQLIVRRKVELAPYSIAHVLLALTSIHHYAAGPGATEQALAVYGVPAGAAAGVAYLAMKRGSAEKSLPIVGSAVAAIVLLAWAAWNTATGPDLTKWLALVVLATLAGIPYWAWLAEKRNPRHVEVNLPGHLVPDASEEPADPFKPIGLAGAAWHGARDRTASGYRATLALPAGTNGRKVADTKGPDLAHLLDVGVDDVELLEDPHRASRVEVLVHTDDLLARARPWPLATNERIAFLDPTPVGINRAGELCRLNLHGKHLLIAGATGSGKSNVLTMIAAAASLDPTVALLGIDGKVTELPLWRARMAAYVDDHPPSALALLDDLRAVMGRRQRLLRDRGRREVTPGDEFGTIVLLIDELARFVLETTGDLGPRFLAALLDLLQVGRSVGLVVVATTQRPSGNLITGDVRAGFTYRMAMHMGDSDGSRMILGNGVAVDASKLDGERPGLAYLAAGELRPRMMRTFHVPDPDLETLAARAGEVDPPELPGLVLSDTVTSYDPDRPLDDDTPAAAGPLVLAPAFPNGDPIPERDAAMWAALAAPPPGVTVEELQLAGVGFTSRQPIADRLRKWTAAGWLRQVDDRPRRWHRVDQAAEAVDETAA